MQNGRRRTRRMGMAENDKTKYSGGCACGEIRFGFYDPLVFKVACHCRACQYTAAGGPAFVVGVQRDQFRITKGTPKEFATLAESQNMVTRSFCGNCGTHLFASNDENAETVGVKVGSLDDPSAFRPRLHIWMKEAQPWHKRSWFTLRFGKNAPVRGTRTDSE